MPTYDFTCKKCGRDFSLFTTISGRKNASCPHCESKDVVQRFTGFLYSKPGGDNGGAGGGSACSSGNCSGCSGC
ncbi:MAG TPA: zinc ribbon domain-containing protein [Clostridia bacterium]|nr:zinc ribbon domain-containing protein [Clostridia bacterium]